MARTAHSLFVCLIACSTLAGLSEAHAQNFASLASFERLDLSGSVHITVETGSESEVIVLSGADVAEMTAMDVSDGVLYVVAPRDRTVELLVRTPRLVEIVSRGSAKVRAESVTGSELVIDTHGAGTVDIERIDVQELSLLGSGTAVFRVSGNAKRQVIDLDGAGQVEAGQLLTRSSEVRVRGAGEVVLQATEHLDVDVAGAAKVTYTGTPAIARQIRGVGIVQAVR